MKAHPNRLCAMLFRFLRGMLLLSLAVFLAGCKSVVLSPSGDIAQQQGNLVIVSTVLMLLIIVPVMILTAWFAWRYRASNTEATYDPDWHHSTSVELGIWAAPLLIVIALGAVTWITTHTLDPFRPLARISATQTLAKDVKPLQVQVVALDWKWLFIYPDYGIATVNELAAPIDTPINFQITSSTVMNSFYIPALAGQIYAMPAMETKLHAVINKIGNYEGFSANYSGAGFSGMKFRFHGMSKEEFEAWIQKNKDAGNKLDRPTYQALEKPSEREAVRRYAQIDPKLYDAILNLCVDPNKMCQRDMMAIDAKGGLGLAGVYNVGRLAYDRPRARGHGESEAERAYVLSLCTIDRSANPTSLSLTAQPLSAAVIR
nr:ubiquinol oxidase subunit II [Stenotrophobium rhamnosiphilum]